MYETKLLELLEISSEMVYPGMKKKLSECKLHRKAHHMHVILHHFYLSILKLKTYVVGLVFLGLFMS